MLFIQNPPHREQTKYKRAAFVTVYLSRAVHICTIYVNSYCSINPVELDILIALKKWKLNVIIAVFWLGNATKKETILVAGYFLVWLLIRDNMNQCVPLHSMRFMLNFLSTFTSNF